MARIRRVAAGLLAGTLATGVLPPGLVTPATAAAPSTPTARAGAAGDRTSARERKRVDSVRTPKLGWYTCFGTATCATARLPRDYDRPRGAKVTVALLKRPAKDRAHKLGTLFVNPGGPGGSGVEIAYYAPYFLGPNVLDRFDVVGFDPRGTNFSSNVKCFSSVRKQTPVMDRLTARPFPVGSGEERSFRRATDSHARACSTSGKPLSAAVSTAEVARDMDVLRRAVGDQRLSYLGFSYGSYLGQVYANLFPDRVRAVAIDGVVDPLRWAGRSSTKSDPLGDRLRSADGSWRALRELLVRCQRAGASKCAFAGKGNPLTNFDLIAQRLKRHPIVDVDPATGDRFVFGYSELISAVLGSLYSEFGYADIDVNLTELIDITAPTGSASTRAALRAAAIKGLQTRLRLIAKRQFSAFATAHLGFPYDNGLDAFAAVSCTDSVNARNLSSFGSIAAAADRRAKYFGRLWLWQSAQCSSTRWTVKDEDAYRGGFGHRSAKPVLVVGNYWDPATNYAGAQAAARLLPGSRLLSSNSWGHTAYNTSACVTDAVDAYLVSGRLPTAGRVCQGDVQPFTEDLSTERRRTPTELGLVRLPAQVRDALRRWSMGS